MKTFAIVLKSPTSYVSAVGLNKNQLIDLQKNKDLGLYENFLEHARVTESLVYRRRNIALRIMELAFEMPDSEFVGLYRLNKGVCRDLIQELELYLPNIRHGISITSKVLSTLSFYASGLYQRFIGASAHNKMHQVSVSNCMRARARYSTAPLTL